MTRSREISARARRLWTRLAEWYGARLAEQFGQDPPPDWCAAIDRVSNTEIRSALATIRMKHPSHPPTLPEFEAALAPERPSGQPRDSTQPTLQDRMVELAMSNHRLTRQQLIAHWTFHYSRRQWTDAMKRNRDELAECIGVLIPATQDGGVEIFVKAADLDLRHAA